MEALFPILVGAIAASVAYLVTSFRRQAQMEAWQRTAQQLGLDHVTTTAARLFDGGSLEGDSGVLHVRLEPYRRGKYEHGTRIVVTGFGHGYGGLWLRREGLASAFEKNLAGEREIELGDEAFDREVYVLGQPAMAFAALGPDARPPIARLLAGRVAAPPGQPVSVDASLGGDKLEVRVRENGFSSGNRERLAAILGSVLDAARPLVVRGELPVRIARNAEQEPDDGARLKAVTFLSREFPTHPATQERLRAALVDPSDEVRLRAATMLGEAGRETLLELATGVAAGACAPRAIAALGPRLTPEDLVRILRAALAAGIVRRETTLACLELLSQHGTAEAEPVALEALAVDDAAIVAAAARALGRVGSVAAVAPLLEAGGRGPRSACRQAIAEIQARLPGAGAGQLSIAGGEAGALSLADGEAGQLSLAGVEASPLPVPGDEEPLRPPAATEPDPPITPPPPRLRE